MEEFINKGQTLVGSALGPFLAVIISAIGFWIKSVIENKNERKEYLRRIDIGMIRSLNNTYVVHKQFKRFLQRVKSLADEAKKITDDKTFFLERVNFPTIRHIYWDADMPYFKIKSYYLHNKLVWALDGIKEMNETILNIKNDFKDLLKQNELLVVLMRSNPNPQMQREVYIKNLEDFANVINDYVEKSIKEGIEIMTQVKIYNEKIRGRYGYWFWWKQEGTRLKYFKGKKAQKMFSRNLESLDRIDKVIKKEVETIIEKAEQRSVELSKKTGN